LAVCVQSPTGWAPTMVQAVQTLRDAIAYA
jgi:hypothetical protein